VCVPAVPLLIAATAVSAAGSIASGVQQSQQATYQAKIAEQNRQLAVQARRDAIDQGQRDQIQEGRKQAQLQGAQRVALAGSGVDTTFGTADTLAEGTALVGSENVQQIDRNTAATAKSYGINAMNYGAQEAGAKAQASNALINTAFSTAGTILGGASQVGKLNMIKNAGTKLPYDLSGF
jgi:hypothetical protein